MVPVFKIVPCVTECNSSVVFKFFEEKPKNTIRTLNKLGKSENYSILSKRFSFSKTDFVYSDTPLSIAIQNMSDNSTPETAV